MIKKIGLGTILLIGALVIFVATRASAYEVSRTTTIDAPASVVFAQCNSFENWVKWSPWSELDPKMKLTYTGPKEGVGAKYAWEGNEDVGKGSMAITESTANKSVTYDLQFIEPFEDQAVTAVKMNESAPGKTSVTWVMNGELNFVSKIFNLISPFADSIGKDYEKGLANLKRLSMEVAKAAPAELPVPTEAVPTEAPAAK